MWAADARKRFEGELVAWQLAHLPAAVWGGLPPFERLNPYQDGGPMVPPKSEAQVERESEVGWSMLTTAFVGEGAERIVIDTQGRVVG